jgi:hypothetical protein
LIKASPAGRGGFIPGKFISLKEVFISMENLQIITYITDHGAPKIAVGRDYKTTALDPAGKYASLEVDGRYIGLIQPDTEPATEPLDMEALTSFATKWQEEKKRGPDHKGWEALPGKVRTFLNILHITMRYQEFLFSSATEENIFVKMLVEKAICENLGLLVELMREIEAGDSEWKTEFTV